MAKRKKKKKATQPIVASEPELTEGQYYWCVNCGHHGDYGFHRKKSVKCEMCGYDDVSLWTLGEINDEHLDNIWLERFKTKKLMEIEKKNEVSAKRHRAHIGKPSAKLKKKIEHYSKPENFDKLFEGAESEEQSVADKLAEIRKL